jgi:hypothetical protein
MSDRSDHDLGFATVTQKLMPNGEVRTRMKFPSGITMTMTEMPDWKWQEGEPAPVQEGHYHKGLTEVYYVLNGWMLYVGQVFPHINIHVVEQGETVTFHPCEPHIVLLGPEAIIQTTSHGLSEGNADKKGLDWWPVKSDYSNVQFTEGSLNVARRRRKEKTMLVCG